MGSLKKLEIELPYDPAIPLLGIHTNETRSERDMCTPMFIAALFIIARTWKQPKIYFKICIYLFIFGQSIPLWDFSSLTRGETQVSCLGSTKS